MDSIIFVSFTSMYQKKAKPSGTLMQATCQHNLPLHSGDIGSKFTGKYLTIFIKVELLF